MDNGEGNERNVQEVSEVSATVIHEKVSTRVTSSQGVAQKCTLVTTSVKVFSTEMVMAIEAAAAGVKVGGDTLLGLYVRR